MGLLGLGDFTKSLLLFLGGGFLWSCQPAGGQESHSKPITCGYIFPSLIGGGSVIRLSALYHRPDLLLHKNFSQNNYVDQFKRSHQITC